MIHLNYRTHNSPQVQCWFPPNGSEWKTSEISVQIRLKKFNSHLFMRTLEVQKILNSYDFQIDKGQRSNSCFSTSRALISSVKDWNYILRGVRITSCWNTIFLILAWEFWWSVKTKSSILKNDLFNFSRFKLKYISSCWTDYTQNEFNRTFHNFRVWWDAKFFHTDPGVGILLAQISKECLYFWFELLSDLVFLCNDSFDFFYQGLIPKVHNCLWGLVQLFSLIVASESSLPNKPNENYCYWFILTIGLIFLLHVWLLRSKL